MPVENEWILPPVSAQEIAELTAHCRRLVRRRAALSAGVAMLPLPGVDVLSDLRLLSRLVDEVNQAFGLSPAQIERLQPALRLLAYEAAVGIGGMLVGKFVTKEVVLAILRRSGARRVAQQAGKLVPVAGQLASATIGFFAFRQIGYQHVDACAKVAGQLLRARP
jgi:hypothetical protein